jgi:hypothetical protein
MNDILLFIVPMKNVSKPFSKPLKAGCIDSTVSKPEPVVVKPRYDPTIPGALVMPAPSDSHQVISYLTLFCYTF